MSARAKDGFVVARCDDQNFLHTAGTAVAPACALVQKASLAGSGRHDEGPTCDAAWFSMSFIHIDFHERVWTFALKACSPVIHAGVQNASRHRGI